MAKISSTLTLKAVSSTSHTFDLYSTDHEFKETWGGVYAFSKRTQNQSGGFNHTILYIGKAVKFNQRLDNHEKWETAKKLGCNCICILKVDKETDMLNFEKDLIKGQKPQLNVVHNS